MTNTTNDIVKRIEDRQAAMLPGQKSMDKLTLHYLANIAVAAELAEAYVEMEAGLNDIDVLKATGTKLDAIVSPVLIEGRNLGDFATGSITFYAPFETSEEITIPAGTKCYAILEDGSKIYFVTTVAGAIAVGAISDTVDAKAVARGLSGNIAAYDILGMVDSITGITSCENQLPFDGGTADETDDELRERYFDAIQAPGKATALMIQRALNDITTVSEVKVWNYGSGDLGVLVAYSGGIEESSAEISAAIKANIAAGTQARGMLCATIDSTQVVVLEDDVYGGLVWVRPRWHISAEEVLAFEYLDMEEVSQTAVATIPAGTHRGVMIAAEMASEASRAKKILTAPTSPAGNSYDVLLGMGEPGYLYNLPELVDMTIVARIRLTDTPETGLKELIEASLADFANSYIIGENAEYSDVQRFLFNLFDPTATDCIGRPFIGIDTLVEMTVTAGGQAATKNGDGITVEEDWKLQAGSIDVQIVA
jgi:uncharacterized phage protein gp47/JayE